MKNQMKFFRVIEDESYAEFGVDVLKYIICAESPDHALHLLRERYINTMTDLGRKKLTKITEPDELKRYFWDHASFKIIEQGIPAQLGSIIQFDYEIQKDMVGFFGIQDGVLTRYDIDEEE